MEEQVDSDIFTPRTDRQVGITEVIVEEISSSEDSSAATSSSEDERPPLLKSEIPAEYWYIQKLVKYMKSGNQTATVVSLCSLKDHDLSSEVNQLAIQDIGGLEVLINLLETKDLKCRLGSLSVLCDLSQNPEIKKHITDLGGIPLLVKNLQDPARDLQILVAETLFNVAQVHKARKHIRRCDGIPKLVDLLDINENLLTTNFDSLNSIDKEIVNTAKASARALWSISQSVKNIHVMMKSGAVPLLARLLRSVHMEVVIPTVGTIAKCASDPGYQLAIQTEGMIKDIVKHLSAQDYPQLRTHCAATIFRCASDAIVRDQVRQAGGLDPLVAMAKDMKARANKPLLAAVTGAIWKCAKCPVNVERFDQLQTVQALVKLIENIDESSEVLSNAVGALSQCLKFEHNRETLRKAGGIPPLVNLLNYTFAPLLENVPKVLCESAKDPDSMRVIEELDGVRLLWSLLKSPSNKVKGNAATSLVPCIRYARDSGEMVRCFVGGLELIVSLLKSKDNALLAAVCSAIAEVAKDKENLGIITDHGVVPMLVNLVSTEDPILREHLASAIAYCCLWGSNLKMFGRLGAITPLVAYMASNNSNVHRSTALALYHLSKNSFNCITMHESGVVPFLLKAVASADEELQEAAAGCLGNIRRLALEAETFHLVDRIPKDEDDSDDY